MLRHIIALNKPVRRVFFRFSYVSSLFNIKNREDLILNKLQKPPLNIQYETLDEPMQHHHRDAYVEEKINHEEIDIQDLEEKEEVEMEKEKEKDQQQEASEVQEQKSEISSEDIIRGFRQKLSNDLENGHLQSFQKLIKETLKLLRDKHLKQTDLLQLFRVIRSYRPKNSNKIVFSEATEHTIKMFLTKQKNSKVLKNIAENWNSYDFPTLIKICSLYRYLPEEVIVSSLQKLFQNAPTSHLGYLKHFEIINQIMNKKERLELGPLTHQLIKGGELFNQVFTLSYTDLEVVIKFFHLYNVYTSSRMLGGSVFHQLSMMLRPDRKGYKFDFDLFKQISNIYWGCVNMKSKIKVKFIEDIPSYLQSVCGTSVTTSETLTSLLDGYEITSNFSNVNSQFGRTIEEAYFKASPKEVKAAMPQLIAYVDRLLESLKPEYGLNSMQAPSNNHVKEATIGVIRALLPVIIDRYLLDFLKFEFDPYVYHRVLFRNQGEYEPILNKCLYILEHSQDNSLIILRHLYRNMNNINTTHPKIKEILQQSWKKQSKENHKWPNCLNYYFHYITLANNFSATLKDLNKHVEGMITKLEKSQKEGDESKSFPSILPSKLAHAQYFLPILSSVKPESIKTKSVQKFIVEEIIPIIRRWDAIDFCNNLKVLVNDFDSLPKTFISAMLENTSVLTMIDNEETYLHPDADRSVIEKLVILILNNYKSLDLANMDLKVFQILCLTSKKSFDDDLVKKFLEFLGLKEQKYIAESRSFLSNFQFSNPSNLQELSQLIPSGFNNVMINDYLKNSVNSKVSKVKSLREIKKQLNEDLEVPRRRLSYNYDYDKITTKEMKGLYLLNRLYEAIIKPHAQKEIDEIENKILKLYPNTEPLNDFHHLNMEEEEKLSVYPQFFVNEKRVPNTKFQLLKMKEFITTFGNQSSFQSVDLLNYPIEEQLLRNISRPSYIENQIMPKLNEDITAAVDNLRPWFEKVGVYAKIRNNALMLKSRERKNWKQTVVVIISKPQVFKMNLIAVYLLNRISDVEFVVIEEESSIESAIKSFVYNRNNVI